MKLFICSILLAIAVQILSNKQTGNERSQVVKELIEKRPLITSDSLEHETPRRIVGIGGRAAILRNRGISSGARAATTGSIGFSANARLRRLMPHVGRP